MTGERFRAPDGDERAPLAAVLADWAAPDYQAIRALTALSDEPCERVARLTAMGRQFVVDVRRRVNEAGADALLDDPPSVCERILETATHQLVQHGRRDLTMRTVSRETGIPRRTLYNVYSSSFDLIQTCHRRAQTIWRARFEQRVLDGDPDAERRLFAVFDVIAAWVGSPRFRDDQALRARPSFADELRDDDLREHLAEVERFATGLAVAAKLPATREYGAFVATTVAGATAWFDRPAEARAASVAVVERLIALTERF